MSEPTSTSVPPVPSTALAVVDGSRFAVARADDRGLSALRELHDVGGGIFDLTQVRVPTGGGSWFQLPDDKGEIRPEKDIVGVLAAVRGNLKAWYELPFSDSGGGSQPDCSSGDSEWGTGVRDLPKVAGKAPSRQKCSECKFNQFGSARKGASFGKGKDCQDYALLIFYREGDFLPCVLKASATSLQNLKKYNIFLTGRGMRKTSVTTVIGLEQDQSDSGIAYSKLTFRIGARLDEAASAKFEAIGEALSAGVLARFDPTTYVEPSEPAATKHETVSSTPLTQPT